jgi:hypothetical protein
LRVLTAVLAAQPLAVEQAGAGQFDPHPGALQALDRLAVERLGGVAFGRQRAGTGQDAERPVGARSARAWLQPAQRGGGDFGPAAPGSRLDKLDQRPCGVPLVGVFAAALGGVDSRLPAAEAVVEHGSGEPRSARTRPSPRAIALSRPASMSLSASLRAPPRADQHWAVQEADVAGGGGDRVGLLHQCRRPREVAGEQAHAGQVHERDRQDGQSAGRPGQVLRTRGEHVERRVVPQLEHGERLDDRTQQQPAHDLFMGLECAIVILSPFSRIAQPARRPGPRPSASLVDWFGTGLGASRMRVVARRVRVSAAEIPTAHQGAADVCREQQGRPRARRAGAR